MTHRFVLLIATAVVAVAVWEPGWAGTEGPDPRTVCFGGAETADKDRDTFIAACSRLIETDLTEPEERAVAFANRGEAYMALGRFDAAMEDCQSASRIAPRQVMTEKLCGDAYLAKGDADAAITHYTRAIRATSVFLRGLWIGRIQAYLAAQRYDDALSDANYFIGRDKTKPEVYVLRGKAYFGRGDLREAQDDFEQALRLDSNSAEAEDGREQAKAALAKPPAPN
jgi:tetratricopeptide (TPR) repeat protein